MYSVGDLIEFNIAGKNFYGEIVGQQDGKVEVSRIKQTEKQGGRIWEFVDDDKWSAIDAKFISKHIVVDTSKGSSVAQGWKELGFIAGGDGITMCMIEDEDQTTMPIFQADNDSEDEEETKEKARRGGAGGGLELLQGMSQEELAAMLELEGEEDADVDDDAED